MPRTSLLAAVALLLAAAGAQGQADGGPRRLGGPRLGVTVVSGPTARTLRDSLDVAPVMTQFGWQFETQLYRAPESGLTVVTEWVPLAGGLEQNLLLPSLSWLVGIRTDSGAEFAIGPNLSIAGSALAIAGGVSLGSGDLRFPVNLAVVPSREGVRVSLLTGFVVARDEPRRRPRWRW